MEKTDVKRYIILKGSLSLLFFLVFFLAVFSSMCPKFVPLVEVPLYLTLLVLGIVLIFKAKTKLSVLARFLLASTIAVIVSMTVSGLVHARAFPYEMFDEATKERIQAHNKKMIDSANKSQTAPELKE